MAAYALIVAAGKGVRAGGGVPKQYRPILGQPLLCRSIASLAQLDGIQTVISPDGEADYEAAIAHLPDHIKAKLLPHVFGGTTRQQSVLNGLNALKSHEPDYVFIHDAARPFVPQDALERLLNALQSHIGAIAALPVADSLKRGADCIEDDVDRTGLWRAQTPQAFRFKDILSAHLNAAADGRDDFTDDAGVARAYGHDVAFVRGDETIFKVTEPQDFARAEAHIMQHLNDTRTGQGFDVHRLIPADHMWLCGVKIDGTLGLEGHSDADAGLHALTDAILGAIGEGDIGQHFPPTDPKWKGARSDAFLAHAVQLVHDMGGIISHCDITLICERPKIGPHRPAMQARVAEILNVRHNRVSIKATTTEKLGFTGRGEGLAALAIATIRLPWCDNM